MHEFSAVQFRQHTWNWLTKNTNWLPWRGMYIVREECSVVNQTVTAGGRGKWEEGRNGRRKISCRTGLYVINLQWEQVERTVNSVWLPKQFTPQPPLSTSRALWFRQRNILSIGDTWQPFPNIFITSPEFFYLKTDLLLLILLQNLFIPYWWDHSPSCCKHWWVFRGQTTVIFTNIVPEDLLVNLFQWLDLPRWNCIQPARLEWLKRLST